MGLYFIFFQLKISHTQNIFPYAGLLSDVIQYNETKSHSCHFCRKYNSTTIHTFYTDLQLKQKSVWLDIITLAFILMQNFTRVMVVRVQEFYLW